MIFNLSEKAMNKAKLNFRDPMRHFITISNKVLFAIRDLFVTIRYFYLCFPVQFKQKMATDHQIHEGLIRIYV